MSEQARMLPLALMLTEKACKQLQEKGSERWTADEFTTAVRHVVLDDEDVKKEVDVAKKDLREEPSYIGGLRGSVRPILTMLLTVTFVFLVVVRVIEALFGGGGESKVWDQVFTVFLAIYGPIIGFWFGQQTALKSKSLR